MYGVQDLLTYTALLKPVETVKTGIPKVLPDPFWSLTENISGDRARVIEFQGTRKLTRIVPYGAPPRQVEHFPLSDRTIILLHTSEEIAFRDELLRILRQWDKYEPQQMFAKEEITRQGVLFRQMFDNTRVAAVTANLANGALWYDADGVMQATAAGATTIVDQGIPAANKNQLNGLISAPWSTAGTDIVGQINALKVRAVQATGYPLKYAFYGQNIPGYFNGNTSIQNYWWRNTRFSDSYMDTGILPEGMLGLTWVPVQEAFYEDPNGNQVNIFPGDQITFTPDITAATYAMYQGSELVPTGSALGNIYGDSASALGGTAEVFGMSRYAKMLDKPVRLIDYGADTFLPRFKVPNAFFMADVTP